MTDFSDGYLIYDVFKDATAMQVCELIKALTWDDGFIAFSQGEFRWQGRGFRDIDDLVELFSKRHNHMDFDGYVMEADLWRKDGGFIYEELAVQRVDASFFVQYWQLHTSPDTISDKTYMPCYYRHSPKVIPLRQSKLFKKGDLSAIEVIVPLYRLHIFMTTKG